MATGHTLQPLAMVAGGGQVAAVVLAMVAVVAAQQATIQRRCYVCRSRGELGDCRDEFTPPEPGVPGAPVKVGSAISLG